MNCIFCCIFNKEQYIQLFYLLVESILAYGNLIDTEILVYTSTPFMNKIKKSHLFSDIIKFEINDTYNTIDKACKSRLDLFDLSISKYAKILYLDVDILVTKNINPIFNICEDEIIYALEEGSIVGLDYWGASLFGNESNLYEDKSAFTSAILLFKNCEKVKDLFDKIRIDITKREHFFCDQPFIVYNAFKYNMYNNKLLKAVADNYQSDVSDKIIRHFPGGPGIYEHKLSNMTHYLTRMKDQTIDSIIHTTKTYINDNLMPIISSCGEPLEGNIFMYHHTSIYTNDFLNKVKNISNMVLNSNIKNVMEIGFNAGFSVLLMLLSNSNLHVRCFDLGEHSYTLPCYYKLKETFGDRLSIVIGDSRNTLKQIQGEYDLIHIDGGHLNDVAESDIIESYRLSKPGTILIMDDYDFSNLHELWNQYIIKYDLKKLDIAVYDSPHHDIKYIQK